MEAWLRCAAGGKPAAEPTRAPRRECSLTRRSHAVGTGRGDTGRSRRETWRQSTSVRSPSWTDVGSSRPPSGPPPSPLCGGGAAAATAPPRRRPPAARRRRGERSSNRQVKVGFIPLTDAASVIMAYENGDYADRDLDVTVLKQASWPATRDALLNGDIDMAHCLFSMPMSLAAGIGGAGERDLRIAMMLNNNGQAITPHATTSPTPATPTSTPPARSCARAGRRRWP